MAASTPRLDRLDKNILINGAFEIFQRGNAHLSSTAMAGSGSLGYSHPDRWRVASNGAADTGTTQRIISSPNTRTKYSIRFALNADNSTDEIIFEQRIESANVRDAIGKKLNFGFYIFSNSATTVELELFTANSEDDFSATTSQHTDSAVISTGAWEQVKFEGITTPSAAVNGLVVRATLTDMSVTGSSQNHDIAQAILNIGDFGVQEFSRAGRNFNDELIFCERYYEKSYGLDFSIGAGTQSGAGNLFTDNATGNVRDSFHFRTRKRAIPTVTIYSPVTGTSGVVRDYSVGGDAGFATADLGETGYYLSGNTGGGKHLGWHWTADAEL